MLKLCLVFSAFVLTGCSANEQGTGASDDANISDAKNSNLQQAPAPQAAATRETTSAAVVQSDRGRDVAVEDVRIWSCTGEGMTFTMRLSGIEKADWGMWGKISYSPRNPYDGVQDSDNFSYDIREGVFTIGGNPEYDEPGRELFRDEDGISDTRGAGQQYWTICRPA